MANKARSVAKERFWRRVLARFQRSNLAVRAFCQQEQIAESAFYAWRRTIAERNAATKSPQRPAFLPVIVDDDLRFNGELAIELAGGRVLRLPASIPIERLTEIIAALEARGTR